MPYFIAPDGARIFYQDEGRGRPLLLLHGFMAHREFFRFQRPLCDRFRLIAPDLRGHGDSRDAGGPVTVEQAAHDVAALAETLDLEGAVGIGWSLGAAVLWHVLAGPSGKRFAGSVVVDMTPRVLNDGDWELGLSADTCEARRIAIRDDFSAFARNAGQAIFAEPQASGMEALARWSGEEFARNDSGDMGIFWASLARQDLRPLLHDISQPTLVIRGAHSQLYGPDTADYLVGALPNARAVQFDRSGHAPHLEQPELFNSLITEFAAGLPRVREPQDSI